MVKGDYDTMAGKSYDKQFKIATVKLVLEDEVPVAQAAFPGKGTALYSYQYQIKKLQQENSELR